MAVPRNRHSKARTGKKRAHMAKKPKHLANCSNCKEPVLPHHICKSCGFYNKRSVIKNSE